MAVALAFLGSLCFGEYCGYDSGFAILAILPEGSLAGLLALGILIGSVYIGKRTAR